MYLLLNTSYKGKYMVSMVVSYTDDYENTVKEFVDNITVLD